MADTTRTSAGDFLSEVVEQLKKVTWPDWEQLKESTGIILVFVLVLAAVIWLMDVGVNQILNVIRSLFG